VEVFAIGEGSKEIFGLTACVKGEQIVVGAAIYPDSQWSSPLEPPVVAIMQDALRRL
jgi:hypothetical protein